MSILTKYSPELQQSDAPWSRDVRVVMTGLQRMMYAQVIRSSRKERTVGAWFAYVFCGFTVGCTTCSLADWECKIILRCQLGVPGRTRPPICFVSVFSQKLSDGPELSGKSLEYNVVSSPHSLIQDFAADF
eukprot:4572860-Pleurochrysis_carterae.AAC.2